MFWVEVLVHTSFFLFFLPIFYFEYVAPLQSYSVVSDIFDIVQPEFLDIALLNSLNSTQNLTTAVNTAADYFSFEENDFFARRNSIIKLNAYLVCELVGFGFLSTGLGLAYYYGLNIVELLLSNVIVLSFIIISEFFIVGAFFKNFREIDADFVKASFVGGMSSGMSYDNFRCPSVSDYILSLIPSWIAKLVVK
jgi:hypothetical protein